MNFTKEQLRIEIDPHVYEPTKDKPGYLSFVRNITPQELSAEVKRILPPDVIKRLEWYGSDHHPLPQNKDIPAAHAETKYANLFAIWAPGNSEGFIIRIHADSPAGMVAVWSAKCFELMVAVSVAAFLQSALHSSGTAQADSMNKLFNLIED